MLDEDEFLQDMLANVDDQLMFEKSVYVHSEVIDRSLRIKDDKNTSHDVFKDSVIGTCLAEVIAEEGGIDEEGDKLFELLDDCYKEVFGQMAPKKKTFLYENQPKMSVIRIFGNISSYHAIDGKWCFNISNGKLDTPSLRADQQNITLELQ